MKRRVSKTKRLLVLQWTISRLMYIYLFLQLIDLFQFVEFVLAFNGIIAKGLILHVLLGVSSTWFIFVWGMSSRVTHLCVDSSIDHDSSLSSFSSVCEEAFHFLPIHEDQFDVCEGEIHSRGYTCAWPLFTFYSVCECVVLVHISIILLLAHASSFA